MADKSKAGHRQKLRERFMDGEEASRTDELLLELLLCYAIPQKDIQPLAKKLIDEFGNLSNILAQDFEMLCKFNGIKVNSAVLLKLVDWIRTCHPSNKAKQHIKKRLKSQLPNLEHSDRDDDAGRRKETGQTNLRSPKSRPLSHGTEIFTNSVLKEAIEILPNLPNTSSLNEIRLYLQKNLHYNAEQTRHRYAGYIIRRLFPGGKADQALRTFSKHFRGSRDLREVCFCRFLKAEPLEVRVIEDLLLPNIGAGQLTRDKINSYLIGQFPASRSIKKGAKAVCDALSAGGIAKVNRTDITFSYRTISIPAFAFILHGEFPVPGMYDILKIETNRIIRAMLWNPERIPPALIELRNCGLISKVSDIDNIRQFTTRWSLDEIAERLTSARKTS